MENVFMLRPPSISLVSTMPAVSRRVAPIDVLLLLMAIIWGTNYAIIKHAFTEMDPQAFNALRMTVASSTFVAVMAWMQWRERRRGPVAGPESSLASIFHTPERVTGREWLGLAGLGVVGQCLYQYCFISGLSQTSVANSALLIAATPVLIAIITGVFGQEPVGWRHWAGAALSLIGIYIVVGQGASIGGSSLRGDLTMSAAVVCWTLYTPWRPPADAAAFARGSHGDLDADRVGVVRPCGLLTPAISELREGEWCDVVQHRLLGPVRAVCGVHHLVRRRTGDRQREDIDLLEPGANRRDVHRGRISRRVAGASEDHRRRRRAGRRGPDTHGSGEAPHAS
jgi:hypothetical protein